MTDRPLDSATWSRIEAIFQEALDRPADQRDAFVRVACAGEGGLVERVEALLAADRAGPGLLDTSPLEAAGLLLAGAPSTGDLPATVPLPPDTRVGPFRVLGVLGRGGMGTVYRAERADGAYQQQVALKVVSGGPLAGDLERRFLRERQILARLQHPGISRLLDGGLTDEGHPYLAMELVEGRPLLEWAEATDADLEARIRLMLEICDAVQYAHRNLVVHRDLKPSNVLVDAGGRPHLLDFGIAHLLEADAGDPDDAATRTGMLLLTPQYAAPEQLRGGTATTATDVYSLGAVLYELLARRRPFEGDLGSWEQMLQSTREDPPIMSRAVPADEVHLRRSLRGDLDTIVAKALRREPERRYPSVEALADDLERYLAQRPVSARPDTLTYRLGRYVRRHRTGVAAALTVAVALVAGLASTAWQARATRLEARRTREVSDFLFSLFDAADPEQNAGVIPDARELLDRGAARVRSLGTGAGPEIRADIFTTLGLLYQKLGLLERADTLLREAVELAQSSLGDDERTARALGALGTVAIDEGRYQEAEDVLRRSLELRDRIGSPDTLRAEALGNLGVLQSVAGRLDSAVALHRRALAIDRRALGPAAPRVATDLNNLGLALDGAGNPEEAEPLLRDALRIRLAAYGERHPLVAASYANLAAPVGSLGDLAGAEALHRKALAIRREIYGSEHPDIARALDQIALYADQQGRFHEADSLYREALAMRRRLLGEDHPDVAATLNNLATLRYRMGDYAGAAAAQVEVVRLWKESLGPEHANYATALNNLGVMRMKAGDPVQGERDLEEALALRRRIRGEMHEDVGASLLNVGDARRARGRLSEADSLYRAGLVVLRESTVPGHWRRADAEVRLGRVLVEEGRPGDAIDILRDGLDIREATFVEDDLRIAEARLWLGVALAHAGSTAEARPLLSDARDSYLEQRGPDDADALRAAAELARLGASGRPDDGR